VRFNTRFAISCKCALQLEPACSNWDSISFYLVILHTCL